MGRGPWRGIALFLLFGIVIAAVAAVAYNVGVDHGTTVEASRAEYEIFAAKDHDPDLHGDVLWAES